MRSTTPWPASGTARANLGTVPIFVRRKWDCPLLNCQKVRFKDIGRRQTFARGEDRRRLPHPRSTDRPPGRRLRGAVRRRGIAGASPRAGICPAADRPGHRPARSILAVGGHLKNTVALGLAGDPLRVVLSPHVGDLDSPLAVDVFRRAIDDLVEFFQVRPAVVACDLHPDYASTRAAEELAARWNAPLVPVQHHHAHVAACMAEHRLAGPVLGLAWDGVGYGGDGTIWGGEALVCQGDEFVRLAHLRTFPLPGGDLAMRQPRRAALGLLYEILGDAAAEHLLAPENTGKASATHAASSAQTFSRHAK